MVALSDLNLVRFYRFQLERLRAGREPDLSGHTLCSLRRHGLIQLIPAAGRGSRRALTPKCIELLAQVEVEKAEKREI